jgi:hypothetical protein
VRIGVLADAVKLQVGDPESCLAAATAYWILRESMPLVAACALKYDLPCVGDGVQEVGEIVARLPKTAPSTGRGLIVSASSRICLMSSNVNSWT